MTFLNINTIMDVLSHMVELTPWCCPRHQRFIAHCTPFVCLSVPCMLVTQKRKAAESLNLKHMIPLTIVTDLANFSRMAKSQGHYGSQYLWTKSIIHGERLRNFAEILSPQSVVHWLFKLWKVNGQCLTVRISLSVWMRRLTSYSLMLYIRINYWVQVW